MKFIGSPRVSSFIFVVAYWTFICLGPEAMHKNRTSRLTPNKLKALALIMTKLLNDEHATRQTLICCLSILWSRHPTLTFIGVALCNYLDVLYLAYFAYCQSGGEKQKNIGPCPRSSTYPDKPQI